MKKFEKIVIASDLDGTFLGTKATLVERNIERVRYFCDNGGHFTFATGRTPKFVLKDIPNSHEIVNFPAVTSNGACLYDFKRQMPVKEHFIDMDVFMEVADYVNSITSDAAYRGAGARGMVVPALEHEINKREYSILSSDMECLVMPMDKWKDLGLYKVNVMGAPELLLELYPLVCDRFSDRLTVTRSGPMAIEIMAHGTGKAAMLKDAVRERFGDKALLCTVGDQDNDLDMHSISDLPVCPANSNEAVKAICKHCLCDHNDGVIADLIDLLDRQV